MKSFIALMAQCVLCTAMPLWAQAHLAKAYTDVTLYFAIGTEQTDPNHPLAVDLFHTDFEVSFRTPGWEVIVSHDAPHSIGYGPDILPQDALLHGNAQSRWVLYSIPAAFDFIGAKPGEPFWILPQNAGTGALPLGIAAERANSNRLRLWNPGDARGADTEDTWFEVRLMNMRGPADANFALWQADGIHPPVVFMSTHKDDITEKDVFYISAGSHVHMNWGFTQPGIYAVDFRISTVLACDDSLTADCAPPGNSGYYGDGHVDFQDLAWLTNHWGNLASLEDPNTFMFADPNDPTHTLGTRELMALANQWLTFGYPVIEPNDPNK